MRTSRESDRNLPVRSTEIVFGLPVGIPMSSMTVCHCPAHSSPADKAGTGPSLLPAHAAMNVLPSAQSTQPFRISTARFRGRGFAEIQIQRVHFGDAHLVALEVVRCISVFAEHAAARPARRHRERISDKPALDAHTDEIRGREATSSFSLV